MKNSQSQSWFATEVTLQEDTRERFHTLARWWAEEVGSLRGSIEDGDGNVAGRFGELVYREVFGGTIEDDYDYDILQNDVKIDVKTTRRTVPVQPHYNAVVANWNTEQDCDIYYFVSVLGEDAEEPFSKAWLCGYSTPDNFYTEAVERSKGDRDGYGFRFPAACYTLHYEEMRRRDDVDTEVTI